MQFGVCFLLTSIPIITYTLSHLVYFVNEESCAGNDDGKLKCLH